MNQLSASLYSDNSVTAQIQQNDAACIFSLRLPLSLSMAPKVFADISPSHVIQGIRNIKVISIITKTAVQKSSELWTDAGETGK